MSVENRDLRCYVTQAGFNQEALDKQLGRSTDLTHLVIDGTLLPDGSSPSALTDVQNEVKRYQLSRVEADAQNASMLIAEAIIPSDDGGFTINGLGIETSQGVLYAYARGTGDYKPMLEAGQGSDLVVRVQFLPGNADQITLQVDPTAVLATVDFVVQRTQAATETVAGVVEKATLAEAKGGKAGKFPDAAGVLAAFKQFGLGANALGSVTDLNELGKTGFYGAGRTVTRNTPIASYGTVLHIEGFSGGYASQLFFCYGLGAPPQKDLVYVRHKDDGAWEPWHEVFNASSKMGAGSGLDADLVRGLPADFTSSLADTGYQKLPSGLILQWGTQVCGIDSTVDVALPITFPNSFHHVQPTPSAYTGIKTSYPFAAGMPLDLSSFRLRSYYSLSEISVSWIALGW